MRKNSTAKSIFLLVNIVCFALLSIMLLPSTSAKFVYEKFSDITYIVANGIMDGDKVIEDEHLDNIENSSNAILVSGGNLKVEDSSHVYTVSYVNNTDSEFNLKVTVTTTSGNVQKNITNADNAGNNIRPYVGVFVEGVDASGNVVVPNTLKGVNTSNIYQNKSSITTQFTITDNDGSAFIKSNAEAQYKYNVTVRILQEVSSTSTYEYTYTKNGTTKYYKNYTTKWNGNVITVTGMSMCLVAA
ncbi:MAG: hypothetical protein ACI4TX_03450 [Christensenellales bacterium]